MDLVERITAGEETLALVVRAGYRPVETTFVTAPELVQQVGFVVYPAGGEVERHFHRPVERVVVGTPEVLVVRSGECELSVYDDKAELVATRVLSTGDVMIMVSGGHGFRMLEDTVLLEVKQGPYPGVEEKVRF
jgi:hypothetical protein